MRTSNETVLRSNVPRSLEQPVVWVIDGEAVVRQSMHSLIEGAGWRARTFSSAKEFLTQARPDFPNCLVLDVQLPGISGLDLQAQLRDRPETPVIFLATHGDVSTSVRAMKAGAVEFLTKPVCNEVVLSAMQHALMISATILKHQVEVDVLRHRHETLSVREREVLHLVIQGYLNKQIGYELGISEITVKAHRGRVMRKMAAASLAQLVNMATDLGINPPRPASVGSGGHISWGRLHAQGLHGGEHFASV